METTDKNRNNKRSANTAEEHFALALPHLKAGKIVRFNRGRMTTTEKAAKREAWAARLGMRKRSTGNAPKRDLWAAKIGGGKVKSPTRRAHVIVGGLTRRTNSGAGA
ncbi:hypothetical protein G0Q06_02205 [Puniceicoccales bacterium CK1056]|uniref:Uncharacterized protein n=1 Tax=Oceanipulchritudo coccoides TaxID=2706888 RepID=A0A6B2LYY8_9BACT|nr:hypothetical protein [Oceanipulchritudo coccoides]NDV61259.1 hypothetical protein [Oceanipulchritudo coccoides]